MPLWKLHDLQIAAGLQPDGKNIDITGISIDSRTIQKGDLFVALSAVPPQPFSTEFEGGRDGHEFITDAVKNGAVAVLLSKEVTVDIPQLIVEDTFWALWQLAEVARKRSPAVRIVVTGSAGKTTTKNFLMAALQAHGPVSSYNNCWGVPLTLARMAQENSFGVFEVGMSRLGEIAPLTMLVKPMVAVVTNVFPIHVAGVGSLENIRQEKLSVVKGLDENGVLVVPNGLSLEGCVWEGKVERFDPDAPLPVKLLDESFARIACANTALAVARVLGISERTAIEHVAKVKVPIGRGQTHVINGVTIIDDSYNANPASLNAALQSLQAMKGKRKFAIIGDMLELGNDEVKYHQELAEHCLGLNAVMCVGSLMQHLHKALPQENKYSYIDSPKSIPIKSIVEKAQPGDVILIKGSKKIFWVNNFAEKLKDAFNGK